MRNHGYIGIGLSEYRHVARGDLACPDHAEP
jgi:hypothetical protein